MDSLQKNITPDQLAQALAVIHAFAGGPPARELPPLTVTVAWESYLKAKAAKLRPRSIEALKSRMCPLLRAFGDRPLAAITQDEAQRYLEARMATPKRRANGFVTQSAAAQEVQQLCAIASWAVRRGLIDLTKLRGMEAPAMQKARDRVFTVEEVDALVAAAQKIKARELFTIISIMRNSGVRPIELLRLRWQNVDLDRGLLRLSAEITKNKKARIVALLPDGVAALKQMRRSPLPEFVFAGRNPRKPIAQCTLGLQWRKCAEVARIKPDEDGSPPILYGLKHRLASYLAHDVGFGQFQLMSAMGWTSPAVAMKYVRDTEAGVLQNAARVQSANEAAAAKRLAACGQNRAARSAGSNQKDVPDATP